MKKNKVEPSTILSVFLIFAIIVSMITLYLLTTTSKSDKYFGDYNKKITDNLNKQIEYQNEVNKKINSIIVGNYDFDNPYILNNPYGISPLTSLIIFNTEEECKVEVYINDVFVYTVESSKSHVIPIYGLYSNANNYVLLKTPSKEKTINIKTNIFNDEINSNINSSMPSNEKEFFITDESSNKTSILRGFDNNANLMFYLNFGYISNVINKDNHLVVSYNDVKSLRPIKLKMDYLGQIINVSSDISEFSNSNFTNLQVKFYNEKITNFQVQNFQTDENYTEPKRLKTSTIEQDLIDAQMYTQDYKLSLNNGYLTYHFENNIEEILLVKKDSSYTYVYETNKDGIIKVDLNTDASVYIKTKDNYYCLITTLQS